MFSDDKSIETIQQLFLEFKDYLKLQKDYTKLELTEKLTILLSTIMLVLLVAILSMIALFYLSFMIVYILAPVVGGLMTSFGIISAFHVLLIFLLIKFRRTLIITPTVKFLAGLFLKQ